MTRGAIWLADRLIDKELIVSRASAGDRRFQSLALTRLGRAITPKLAVLADENDQEFFADLDIGTRAAITAAMKAIVRSKGLRGRRSTDGRTHRENKGDRSNDYGRPRERCRARDERGLGRGAHHVSRGGEGR
jgi:hypothetical protein